MARFLFHNARLQGFEPWTSSSARMRSIRTELQAQMRCMTKFLTSSSPSVVHEHIVQAQMRDKTKALLHFSRVTRQHVSTGANEKSVVCFQHLLMSRMHVSYRDVCGLSTPKSIPETGLK